MIEITFGTLELNPDSLEGEYETIESVADVFRDDLKAQVVVKNNTITFSVINDYSSIIDPHETFNEVLGVLGESAISDFKAFRIDMTSYENTIQYGYDPYAEVVIMREYYGNMFGDDGDPEWSMWTSIND